MKLVIQHIPLTLNRYRHLHWAAQKRETNKWWRMIWVAIHGQSEFDLPRGRRAKVTVRVWRKRLQDEENFHGSLKPVFDALKLKALIVDDSRKWIDRDCDELKATKDEPERTEIEIEYQVLATRSGKES